MKREESVFHRLKARLFKFSRQGVAMTQFVVRMWPYTGEEPSGFCLSFWPVGRGREESGAKS